MRRATLLPSLLLAGPWLLPVTLTAQAAEAKRAGFAGDMLARQEWTRGITDGEDTRDESRWRIQLRPRLELRVGSLDVGVGGEFNYSQDRNDETPAGQQALAIVRDNYRSRDARLDLAFGHLRLGRLGLSGGRFAMPLPLTEMIWDRDLRAQGGAASFVIGSTSGSGTHLALSGMYSKGAHVFEDESVAAGGSAQLTFAGQNGSSLQLAGSLLQFEDLDRLEPLLRRQNTLKDAQLRYEYRVADVQLSLGLRGPLTVLADYCWNTAVSEDNRGLWLSLAMGALGQTPVRIEYTYARIDKDATPAALNADDFYWGTDWQGHRVEVGSAGNDARRSVHAIAQWQQPRAEDGGGWLTRYRLELRTRF